MSEAVRLAPLLSYEVLDTPAEPAFDDVVRLARLLCAAPVAGIGLVDADREWFKAHDGLAGAHSLRGCSIGAHALHESEILVIPDLAEDLRTARNPEVIGPPRFRFYAGAVLRDPGGDALGTLCVLDHRPRPEGLSPAERDGLLALARQTTVLLQHRRAARALATAHQAGGVGTFEIDIASNLLLTSPEFCRLFGLPLQGSFDAAAVEALVMPEDRAALSRRAERAAGTAPLVTQYRIRRPSDGAVRWIARRGAFEYDGAGRPLRLRGVVQDITERMAAEAEQHTLNQELSHRLKNTLAMVNAIATQTLRHAADRDSVEAFTRRVQALATAHDVLLREALNGAPIGPTIEGVVGRVADPARFDLAGPALEINGRSVLSFSLLIHELATNAVKYGALSREGGRVAAAWRIDDGPPPQLVLSWRETGGPPAEPPAKRGFGTTLIQSGLAGTGRAMVRYENTGLHADFRAPLSQLIAP